ncbi:hypothetical protein [Calidifontibacillus erzurumensis]|uniref:hypothetical protein n=1 Tax=Calidifontibacillus erzurumensis TaxID=2741433 RepID=UPI0035B52CCC
MVKQVIGAVKKWTKEEEGFQVFEKFGLTQGGVLLALGVAAVSITVMDTFWSGVGQRYFSSDTGIDSLIPGSEAALGWGSGAIDTGWN